MKSPPYQVYWDLGKIDHSVKTEEDEENYYKSLLYGCKYCDLIEDSELLMIVHICSENGKSKYEQHYMEAFNRKLEKKSSFETSNKMRITNFKNIIVMKDNKSVYTSWSRK